MKGWNVSVACELVGERNQVLVAPEIFADLAFQVRPDSIPGLLLNLLVIALFWYRTFCSLHSLSDCALAHFRSTSVTSIARWFTIRPMTRESK
jgi:hypothetical protein